MFRTRCFERDVSNAINKNTVVDWNNFLREICAADLLANPIAIGGPNTTVEVDESLFTRRKNHQGRQLPPQWVFGGICRETRECFMYTVLDRRAATLLPIIQGSIRPGTTIMSDMWAAYGGIQAMEKCEEEQQKAEWNTSLNAGQLPVSGCGVNEVEIIADILTYFPPN